MTLADTYNHADCAALLRQAMSQTAGAGESATPAKSAAAAVSGNTNMLVIAVLVALLAVIAWYVSQSR